MQKKPARNIDLVIASLLAASSITVMSSGLLMARPAWADVAPPDASASPAPISKYPPPVSEDSATAPSSAAPKASTPAPESSSAAPSPPGESTPAAPSASAVGNAAEDTSPELKKMRAWEKEFFSRTFTDDTIDQRLKRLEELIFGGVSKGSTDERVSKIAKALNQPADGPAVPSGVAEFVTSAPAPQPPPPIPSPATASETPGTAAGSTGPLAVLPVTGSSPAATRSPSPDLNPVRPTSLTVDKQHFSSVMKPQRVIQNLSDAIRDNPLDAELMYQRGKAYIQIDNPQRALTDLSDAIMSQPNNSAYYLARAFVYHMLGNGVLSELDVKHAQFVDPVFPAKVVWKDN